MFLSAYPLVPVKAILPVTEPVETSGLTMYHATPAVLCGAGVLKLTAVSSAPHTLPFAYITCCMRVSFESSRETTSAPRAAWIASSAAFELRKYSVPPASSAYDVVPGDCAGHNVNPGCLMLGVSPVITLTEANVSRWVAFTLAAPDASWRFENA